MAGSAANAVSRARELTTQRLFPIRGDKWLKLGFIGFLAHMGEGGFSSLGGQLPGLPGSGKTMTGFQDVVRNAEHFVADNLTLIVVGVGATLVLGVAFGALVTWVSSRAEFIFIESVIHDRTAVGEPWERLRVPGSQLFKTRFAVGLGVGVLTAALVILGAVFAWDDLRSGDIVPALVRFVPLAALAALVAIPASIYLQVLRDFVAPIMYLEGVGVREASQTFMKAIVPGNTNTLFTFYLIKTALAFGAAVLATVAMCLTCCLAALPYVGSVVLLPVLVFFRAYSLAMLEELGRAVFPVAHKPEPFRGWF